MNLPVLTSLAEDDVDGSGAPVSETDVTGAPAEPDVPDKQETEPEVTVPAEPEDKDNNEDAGSEGETSTINVEVKGKDVDLPDSDELFAGYVDQLFYAGANDGIATLGEVGANKLTDPKEKAVYDNLKSQIEKIAAGTVTTTSGIKISYPVSWTAETLGISPSANNTTMINAVKAKLSEEIDPIISYLLMDCPYDFYWFDKTEGYAYGFDLTSGGGKYSVSQLEFEFAVAYEYQGAGGWTQIDASKVSGVKKAADNAKAIVAKHANKSDYAKLAAYCQEICDLVSYYDDAAADKNMPYGNPWQLIWVFDGDTNTNVVCEGYAKAFQYLCDLSTFSGNTVCYTICGDMDGGTGAGGHMWNIVTLEGKNYLVDVTNSDTGSIGFDGSLFLAGTKANADGSYTFTIWGDDIKFIYDDDQLSLFGAEVLKLSETNYIQKPKLTINMPAITVTYGDAVSDGVLTGYSVTDEDKKTVEGIVAWASDVTSYGNAGQNTFRAVFIPKDLNTYAAETFEVKVTVNPRPITVTAQKAEKTYGEADPELKYVVDSTTPLVEGESLSGALVRDKGEDVKTDGYAINVGTLASENPNYKITFTGSVFEIKPTSNYTSSAAKEQNVVAGVGTFTKPVFTGVNNEEIPGAVTYSYNGTSQMTYEQVVSELAKLKVGDTGKITYSFVPGSGNYIGRQEDILFTVRDIEFVVDGQQATIKNAVTVKSNPTYGDSWADIVKIKKLTAKVGDESDSEAGHFTLDVTGMPQAGEGQAFRVLYNGTISGKEFKDQEVIRGVVTVAPKALTWDVSGLQAVDSQTTLVGNTATLFGELKVSGILAADASDVKFIPESTLVGTYADTKPGAQKVTLAWADADYVAALTGTKIGNYTLPSALPEITGKINAVFEQTNVPESTDDVQYKLVIETGMSQVPEALKAIEELNTPAKIEERMKSEIRKKLPDGSDSVEVYDVVLMVKDENGNWEKATQENFPKNGLTVTLSYPKGTGKDSHNFEAAHMFTKEMNGHKPGEIEFPSVEKGDSIQFKVTSLSPIALGWKEVKAVGGNGNNQNTITNSIPRKSAAPKTGDTNTILLYALFMMLGAAGVGYSVKRRTMR